MTIPDDKWAALVDAIVMLPARDDGPPPGGWDEVTEALFDIRPDLRGTL